MTLYIHYITLDYTTLHYIHTNSTCIQTSRILNSFQGKMPNRVHYQKAPARYKAGGKPDQPWGRCGATPISSWNTTWLLYEFATSQGVILWYLLCLERHDLLNSNAQSAPSWLQVYVVLLYRLAAASGRLDGERGQDSQVRRSPFVPIIEVWRSWWNTNIHWPNS